ncbi:unnamed protein product [Haemonchus placei]|uniref:BTB domain-containing protein n=1 Tax=Haemonchus placei TaxID=6290 RepID=A0A0N4WQ69_HAEPC|nr:unnamed protein product [Haemonchus placei]
MVVPTISLDVEGVLFKTSISTLTKVKGSYFDRLFQNDWRDHLDKHGHLFVDRDSTIFPLILNYLRDGSIPLPRDEYYLERILREARHVAHVGWNGGGVIFDERRLDKHSTVPAIIDAANKIDLNPVYNVVNNENGSDKSHAVEVVLAGSMMQTRDPLYCKPQRKAAKLPPRRSVEA